MQSASMKTGSILWMIVLAPWSQGTMPQQCRMLTSTCTCNAKDCMQAPGLQAVCHLAEASHEGNPPQPLASNVKHSQWSQLHCTTVISTP